MSRHAVATRMLVTASAVAAVGSATVAVPAVATAATTHPASRETSVAAYGAPALTIADTMSDGVVQPGLVVERQTLATPAGPAGSTPYVDSATQLTTQGSGTRTFTGVNAPVGAFTNPTPTLLTSFSMGQDQNDPATLAVTANVHPTRHGGYRRRSTGRVWVQAYCAFDAGYCWKRLPGHAASAPSVVNADGTIWVFARFGHTIRAAVRPDGSNRWSGWQRLGGGTAVTADPSATLVAPVGQCDVIDVVTTGRDHRLYRTAVHGIMADRRHPGTPAASWTTMSRSRPTSSAAAIGYDARSNRVVLAETTLSGTVLVSHDGGHNWQQLPGVRSPHDGPALLADNGVDVVDIAVRGADGRTYLATSRDGGGTFRPWLEVPCTTRHGVQSC